MKEKLVQRGVNKKHKAHGECKYCIDCDRRSEFSITKNTEYNCSRNAEYADNGEKKSVVNNAQFVSSYWNVNERRQIAQMEEKVAQTEEKERVVLFEQFEVARFFGNFDQYIHTFDQRNGLFNRILFFAAYL